MRVYDDPVEVRRGADEGPEQFLWRGRLWKVRSVVAHWVETGAWWQSEGVQAVIGSDEVTQSSPVAADLLVEREMWRVQAGRGSHPDQTEGALGDGVFDLSFSWSNGCWQLVGCVD